MTQVNLKQLNELLAKAKKGKKKVFKEIGSCLRVNPVFVVNSVKNSFHHLQLGLKFRISPAIMN